MLDAVCAHKTSLNLQVSGHAFVCYVYQFFLRFFFIKFWKCSEVVVFCVLHFNSHFTCTSCSRVHLYPNNISGIFSEVDRGFEPRSGQSKTIKLVFAASPLRKYHCEEQLEQRLVRISIMCGVTCLPMAKSG